MHVAIKTKHWTLDELHSLPDDSNKYEVVRGELFVTPAPTPRHEAILARLTLGEASVTELAQRARVHLPSRRTAFRGLRGRTGSDGSQTVA